MPKVVPMPRARLPAAAAASRSPAVKAVIPRTSEMKACTGCSDAPCRRRSARFTHPLSTEGKPAPRRLNASWAAALAAATLSPDLACTVYARSQASLATSCWPTHHADCASTSRSSGGEVPGVVGLGHDLVRLAPLVPGKRLTGPLAWGFVNDRAHLASSPRQRSF
jgi:hypothetical protein